MKLPRLILLILLILVPPTLFLANAHECPTRTDYNGTWKWNTGRWSKNKPRSVKGTISKASDTLYKGNFFFKKDTYPIDMKAEKHGPRIELSGQTKVGKRTYSMTGTIETDGQINMTYTDGKDTGWLKLSPASQ